MHHETKCDHQHPLQDHAAPKKNGTGGEVLPLPEEFRHAPLVEVLATPLCPVCEHGEYALAGSGYDYEYRTCRNLWQFVKCVRCSHVWLNPRPADSALTTIYPSNYYAYHYETKVHPIARWAKTQLDAAKLAGILKSRKGKLKSALDIGCGTGRFLHRFEQAGAARNHIYGLELDSRVVQRLVEQGFQAHCQRVEDCEVIPKGSLDLATMFHVIEHVDNPRAVASKVAEWLAPGGVFAVETPNLDSFDARLFPKTYWGGYHIPRHWNLFTPHSLTTLLQGVGLEVAAVRFQTGHSFWMYSLHHALRYGARPRPWLAKWFDPMGALLPPAAFTALDKLRGAMGQKTSAMLIVAKKPE